MSDEILNKLRENNPFISSASPFPWENHNPDLPQLSRETSENIEQLIRNKRRNPSLPLAGLVIGGTGSGKTHMMMRILRKIRNNSAPAIFVFVRMLRNPDTAMQHLVSEIFISLRRPHSNGRNQFDVVMSEFWASYHEHLREDGFSSTDKINTERYLRRNIPELDRNFLKCILAYAKTTDENIKISLLDWLSDGLEDDECLELDLPSRDLSSMNDYERESEAEKILISLGLVLAYAKVPMIICFDQLDAMNDERLISAFGDIINLLMNNLYGVLPLCFVRDEIWNDLFIPKLDEAVIHRLRNNIMIMNTCSLSQAQQLIKDRIKSAFPNEDYEKISAWLIERMRNVLNPGASPRMVIELANNIIAGGGIDPVNNAVENAYKEEYRKIQTEPEMWPPDSENLSLALKTWLLSDDNIELVKPDEKYSRYIKLKVNYKSHQCAFIINTVRNSATAQAALRRGIAFLQEYPNSLCFYITERKSYRNTWRRATETLEFFMETGGKVIMLNDATRISWYALAALINRVDNGDVNLYLNSGIRLATREDIKNFVKTLDLIKMPENPEPPEPPMPPILDEKFLIEKLKKIIMISPMKIMTIEKLVNLLSQEQINVTGEQILDIARNHQDIFRIFRSRDGGENLISTC